MKTKPVKLNILRNATELLTSQGRCAEEQQEAELRVPHVGLAAALSPGAGEHSRLTQLLYPHSMLKAHLTHLRIQRNVEKV